MDDVQVDRSEVEGCEEEKMICYSVEHPYVGQSILTSACFYWKEIASHHSIDCHYSVSGCMRIRTAHALSREGEEKLTMVQDITTVSALSCSRQDVKWIDGTVSNQLLGTRADTSRRECTVMLAFRMPTGTERTAAIVINLGLNLQCY